MTATPPALSFFAYFCVSMTPFALLLLFLKEYVTINIDIPKLLLCLTYKETLNNINNKNHVPNFPLVMNHNSLLVF